MEERLEIIFQKIEEFYGNEKFVNFETFINILELLYDFVISETNEGGTGPTNTSLLPIAFNLKDFENEIYNPTNENQRWMNIENKPKILKRMYYGDLIRHYINIVGSHIQNYEYESDINSDINKSLYKWLNSLSKKFTIRIYTTNYDSIIPALLKRNHHFCFDGFQSNVERRRSIPDVNRICNNTDSIVYYQLHGSINWEVVDSDFEPFDFFLVRDGIPPNPKTIHESVQQGQVLLKSNIITGYSKPQRLIQSPIYAMYSSFIHDCSRSSYILTAGFSFSDPHLKKIIINALCSTNTKFLNITNENSIEELEQLSGNGIYDDISRLLRIQIRNLESDIFGNWLIKGKRFYSYYGGFGSFLENGAWDIIV